MKQQISNFSRNQKTLSGGFSLIELLVVIAVIGIIASIAIPAMSSFREQADEASAKRNAQNIAKVGASAQAAGFRYASTSKREAAAELMEGVTGSRVLSSVKFKVSPMNDEEMDQALEFLSFEGNTFVYRADK